MGQAQEAPALGTKLQQSIGTTAETVHVFKDLMREVNQHHDRPTRPTTDDDDDIVITEW